MKLLLDTHIWLWSLLDPKKLSRRVVRELKDPANELWLSPISVWELLALCEKKRVVLNEEPRAWVARAMRTLPVADAPITCEVALETANLSLSHKDPTDRFLAATAKVFGLTLVTADERLIEGQDFAVLANR